MDKKENKSIISVGIPTYNNPEGLKRTLECITKQTYRNLEIIVSDNYSPGQETELVVEKFTEKDQRIKYFKQKENKGAVANFKFVLKKSKGEYFMWAADDDEWDYQFIEVCIRNIGDACSIMPDFDSINRARKEIIRNKIPYLSLNNNVYTNTVEYLTFMAPSLLYGLHKKDSILESLNEEIFDFFDCYFVLRQIVNNSFITLPNLLLHRNGVDSHIQKKRAIIKKTNRFFNYLPFLKKSSYLILQSRKLQIFAKIEILIILLTKISDLFVVHERNSRLFQARLMFLVYLFFRLLFKIYKILKIIIKIK